MSNQETIKVSNAKAYEAFQGKAGSAIISLMAENANLQAALDEVGKQYQESQRLLAETKRKLAVAYEAQSGPPPEPAPPQEGSP